MVHFLFVCAIDRGVKARLSNGQPADDMHASLLIF